MDFDIKSEEELFDKVKPALRTKKHELFANGIEIVKEQDIFDYCKLFIWKDTQGLTLSDVVDSILNTPNEELYKYIINKLNTKEDVI